MVVVTLEELEDENFNAKERADSLLQNQMSMADIKADLDDIGGQVEQRLKKLIAEHYRELCTQAVAVDSLEDGVAETGAMVCRVAGKLDACNARLEEIHQRMMKTVTQMQNVQQSVNCLCHLIRMKRLLEQADNEQNIVRLSSIVKELLAIHEADLLKGIKVAQKHLSRINGLRQETVSKAQRLFNEGLAKENLTTLSDAILAFSRLGVAEKQAVEYRKALLNKLDLILENMTKSTLDQASVKQHRKTQSMPGSASLPSLSVCDVQSSIWLSIENLLRLLQRICIELRLMKRLDQLPTVGALGHDVMVSFCGDLTKTFAAEVAEKIRTKLKNHSVLVRAICDDYPRFVKQFNETLLESYGLSETDWEQSDRKNLRGAWQEVEQSYLAASFSALTKAVETAVQPESIRCHNFAQIFCDTVRDQVEKSRVDTQLFEQVCKNVNKAVYLFCSKCENLLVSTSEASQVIGAPNAVQKQNARIVNNLYAVEKKFRALFDSSSVLYDETVSKAVEYVNSVIESALEPLRNSIEDAVSAIMATMHKEDFKTVAEKRITLPSYSALYMRELQDFLNRMLREHISLYECEKTVNDTCRHVATRTTDLFMLQVSLCRPLDQRKRSILAVDFDHLQRAVASLCTRDTDLRAVSSMLVTMQGLLTKTCQQIVDSEQDWSHVLPASLVVQLLIAMSDNELPLPYATIRWSLSRYVDWWEGHPQELDRLRFLETALNSYENSVLVSEKSEYVATFPVIRSLLQQSLQSLVV